MNHIVLADVEAIAAMKMEAMLTNHNHFDKERNFEQLESRIIISSVEIEEYIKGLLKQN